MSISLVKNLDGSSSDSKPLTAYGSNYAELNGIFYFTANTSEGGGLWQTDGTESGTSLVKQINSSTFSLTKHLFSYGDNLYFASNDEISGLELWISDGTEEGTKLLKDINTGSSSSYPLYFTQMGGYVYFGAGGGSRSGINSSLWRTDGTEAGTTIVKEIGDGALRGQYQTRQFLEFNNCLYFSTSDGVSGYELWKSDGTESGTTLVKDIKSGSNSSDPTLFTVFGDYLYFSAKDEEHGEELWRTDGTEEGTTLVKDIYSGTEFSTPGAAAVFEDHLYFTANNEEYGYELWRTDGTEEGTTLVKDINGGSEHSTIQYLTVSQNALFFSAKDSTYGYALWKTDGTESGTVLVKDINSTDNSSDSTYRPRSLIDYGDELVFFANDGNTGLEVWKSDGTSDGTVLIEDLNSGSSDGISWEYMEESLLVFYESKDILLFPGNNGTTGMELFSLDLVYPSIIGPSGSSGDLTSTKSISENTTEIHTFTSDEDVTWSLNGGADAALFSINSSTGALSFSSAPDYESPGDNDGGNDYVVIVKATDGAGNEPYQTVTVSITDLDEIAPEVSSASPADDATAVATNSNFVLNFSEAVDVETGNIVIYKASDDSVIETIDVTSSQVTGTGTTQITINPSSDLLEQTEYYVQIDSTAFDDVNSNSYSGINDKTSASFTTADETPPTITGPSGSSGDLTSTKSISENKTEIHTFTSDEDVTWTLNGGADTSYFSINSSTGALSFSSAPDYESPGDSDGGNDYVVIVKATDEAGNELNQTVTVSVNDCPELNVSGHQIGTSYRLEHIKDYDGNLHGNTGSVSDDLKTSYKYQGKLEVNNNSYAVYTNKVSGRWVTGKINSSTGEIDFCDHGAGGFTRVVGIYDDPLIIVGLANGGFLEDGVTPAPAQFGATGSDRYIDLNGDGDFDDDNEDRLNLNSQVRFQNDLRIDNLTLRTIGDYDGDEFQEVYWKTNDGTAYLRCLMHADGNIQYANYQSQEQMSDYLTSNGYESLISDII